MAWLDDLLAQLQGGAQPPMFAPPASPFPEVKGPPSGEEIWAQIEAQNARDNAGADRRNVAGMTRAPIAGGPQFGDNPMSVLAAAAPMTLQAPQPSADGTPFGMVPPSLGLAKSMTANAPKAEPEPPMPGAVPTPRPRPVPTDLSSAARGGEGAPAPGGPALAPMSITAPPAAEPSFLSRLSEGAKGMAPALLAAGSALQGDNSVAAGMLKRREDLALASEQQNLTARALLARGAPPAEVAAAVRNPDLMKAMVGRYFETKAPQNVGGRLVREQPDGTVKVIADFSADEKIPAGFRKAEDGTLHFIKGGPADPEYLREKGERNAAPSGYRWNDPKDPDKGLTAIPGGPGEKVDAEVAGRLGLAKSFLGQLPEIRKRVEAGELTGPISAGKAMLGAGGPGEIRRQVDSGAEALLRMLTGAGMNKDEAANYVRRYQFSPTDTIPTVISKLNQLERELNSVGETVGKGRGGWNPPKPVTSGKTANGVSWSVN